MRKIEPKRRGAVRTPGQSARPHRCAHSSLQQGFPDQGEESLLPQIPGIMENGHYTVEHSRASKPKHHERRVLASSLLSGSRLNWLYLNQDGIKRGRVAHVGKFF